MAAFYKYVKLLCGVDLNRHNVIQEIIFGMQYIHVLLFMAVANIAKWKDENSRLLMS